VPPADAARPIIHVDAVDPDTMALWRTVAKVAQTLEEEHVGWCLVGGLMVALFAMEAGQIQRATTDIDVLGDARQRRSGTEQVAERLVALGAVLHEIGGLDRERGFRFEVDGQVVDVLGPDGLSTPSLTLGRSQTIAIPGGTQALQRTEMVELVIDGRHVPLRRPTLIGAILLKARSLAVHDRPEDQREDLITLLGLLDDPRSAAATLRKSEVAWLREIEPRLGLDDPELDARLDPTRLQIARAAYRRLTTVRADFG
jgi:hypothetical protein